MNISPTANAELSFLCAHEPLSAYHSSQETAGLTSSIKCQLERKKKVGKENYL